MHNELKHDSLLEILEKDEYSAFIESRLYKKIYRVG